MTADLFHLVPKIHYGPGAAGQAGPALAWLGARRVLLVSDPGVLAAGVSDAVVRSLSAAGVEHVLHSDLATNPSEKHVDAAAEAYRDGGCDGLIGVGGGSSLDVAKSAATVLSGGGDIRDYEDGRTAVTGPWPPLVLVPTTAGTGSEAVSGAIITDSTRVFKMHVVAVPAHVALCDPLLTLTLPPLPTVASGLDALAHAIGAYTSAERQPLADGMALHAVRQIAASLPAVVADGRDLAARTGMMVGSLSAGISMKGGGAADHAFAHAVNAVFDVLHGVGVALFLPDAMEFNLPHLPERFADIARALGVPDAGKSATELGRLGIEAVRDLVELCRIPSLADLGVGREHVPELVGKVLEDSFHLGLNPVPVGRADAERVLQRAVARTGAAR